MTKKVHKWNYEETIDVYVKCPYCRKDIILEFLFPPEIDDSEECYLCNKVFEFGDKR